MHGRLSFQREDFFLVGYLEDEFADMQVIGLMTSEDEAKKLCEVLAEEDEQDIERYVILPMHAYENHEDFLNEEEVE